MDQSGAVLGTTVTARQVDTGLVRVTAADPEGRYTLTTLPVGAYEIRAELDGFQPLLRQGVTLTVTEVGVVDLTLDIGWVDEVVTVTVFNRANFGIPALTAFAGVADGEAPLASFGRIRNTITSARRMQVGIRARF